MNHQLVTGAGPVGATVALALADAGHHVRLLTRSGSGPDHPLIERRRADVNDRTGLDAALEGAGPGSAVFHCIHGSSYDAQVWRRELPAAERVVLAAAGDHDLPVIFPESLYSYGDTHGRTMTEASPRVASGGKAGVRSDLLRARSASRTATVSVVASDFYGPRVRGAHAGERLMVPLLKERTLTMIGNPRQPHSWTYVPDLAAAMVRAAGLPELWDNPARDAVVHAPTAPAVSGQQLVDLAADVAGVKPRRVWSLPSWLLTALGVAMPGMRELAEPGHMFTQPFVMDSRESQQRLGLDPTPLDEGLRATLAWWRAELSR